MYLGKPIIGYLLLVLVALGVSLAWLGGGLIGDPTTLTLAASIPFATIGLVLAAVPWALGMLSGLAASH